MDEEEVRVVGLVIRIWGLKTELDDKDIEKLGEGVIEELEEIYGL